MHFTFWVCTVAHAALKPRQEQNHKGRATQGILAVTFVARPLLTPSYKLSSSRLWCTLVRLKVGRALRDFVQNNQRSVNSQSIFSCVGRQIFSRPMHMLRSSSGLGSSWIFYTRLGSRSPNKLVPRSSADSHSISRARIRLICWKESLPSSR